MHRLRRVVVYVVMAGTVLLTGCSATSATGSGSAQHTVAWPATGAPASPTTPSDYAPPPAPAAMLTATNDPAQPTALGVVDAAGKFCTTARASLQAWGGNPLATLWSLSQSHGSATQVKAYLTRAGTDTSMLFAVAPPQIRDAIATLGAAVAQVDGDLKTVGYDLGRAGALSSAIAHFVDPVVAAAWLSLTSFVQAHCSVAVGSVSGG